MDLVIIIGSGAVGKMTVGQELMKLTGFRLFHNHMMIEPVIEIMGRYDNVLVEKLRGDVFDAFMGSEHPGMIFTIMLDFDMKEDTDYVKSIARRFEDTGGTVYWVELVADKEVRLERNKTENRLLNKPSKRDIAFSEKRILLEDTNHRLVSREGELGVENYMRIDNTHLAPADAALLIKERFGLPDCAPDEIISPGSDERKSELRYVDLRELPEIKEKAADWFSSKWHVPREAYIECMDEYLEGRTEYGWYLCLDGERIVGGLGVIENDFHDRKDLTPNICAVYTEEDHRCLGIAGRLLTMAVEELKRKGVYPVYLVTDHVGFYERYGFEYYCGVQCDGEEHPSRMYIHR